MYESIKKKKEESIITESTNWLLFPKVELSLLITGPIAVTRDSRIESMIWPAHSVGPIESRLLCIQSSPNTWVFFQCEISDISPLSEVQKVVSDCRKITETRISVNEVNVNGS